MTSRPTNGGGVAPPDGYTTDTGQMSGAGRNISDYYREQIWVTPSGMFSQQQLDHVLAELGAERIIYSEDFPYVKRDNVTEFLTSAGLSGPQMHAVAHGNAEALLRI